MNLMFETHRPGELVETSRVISTPSEFAKKSLFYVQETGYLKSIKSHLHKRSNLSSYLFCMALSGRGAFTFRDQIYTMHPNDCILIDCMESYTHQSDSEYPWELLWVHFSGYAAEAYYQYFIHAKENHFHPQNPEEYKKIIEQILIIHQKKEMSWELIASKLITDLLTISIMDKKDNKNTGGSSILDKLQSIRDYIDLNYMNKISLDQLAHEFYISKYHLSREYKRVYGITLLDYITAKRITYAKELLRFTKKSIGEIADTCGYPDASYFNKVFQRTEGMSGLEYRKKW